MVDVTDATFQEQVLARSSEVPVVVDLWAPWCGPCRTLGPMIEASVAATNGAVELAKVNVDENPKVAGAFAVQSIPAVFAIKDGKVVDNFIGALPQKEIDAFIARLGSPQTPADELVAQGDEASLRAALELRRDHREAVLSLATLLVEKGSFDEVHELLARIPETAQSRHIGAQAHLGEKGISLDDDVTARLDALLMRVREDETARQEYVDLLEALGPDDPRTATYRRRLASSLF